MERRFSLLYFGQAIVVTVFLSQSLSNSNSFVAQSSLIAATTKRISCIHWNSAAKPDWKTCVKQAPENPHIPSYDDLSIAKSISSNQLYEMQVPKNEMKCHTVERYDYASLPPATRCPALCKLRDIVAGKDNECPNGRKDLIELYDQNTMAVLKSPHYNCNSKYHRKEICVYNVSMSCSTEHVVVSRNPSHTDMAIDDHGDFVQIVDYVHSRVYEKVSGTEWPRSQTYIYSSNFVVVFWSEPYWKPVGSRGFKIHMECDSDAVNSNDDPQAEGSAEPLL